MDDSALACESVHKLQQHNSVHQLRGHGGVSVYINSSFNYKVRIDLSVNKNDIESLTIQIVFKKKKKKIAIH